jgi:hypothetical protein
MDLLGNYSEESEDEQQEILISRPEIKAVTREVTPNPNLTPLPGAPPMMKKKNKKRKKLDISFLPENIQAALARGDTISDSDSDHEETPVSSARGTQSEYSSVNELLLKLPKPKNASTSTEFGKTLTKPIPSIPKTERPIASPPPEIKATASVPHSHESDESDSDSDDVVISSTVDSSSSKASLSLPSVSSSSSNILPPPLIALPSFDYSPLPINTVQYTPTYLPYAPPPPPLSLSSPFPSSTPSAPSVASLSQHQTKKSNSKSNNFRKRDREIESSLLRGDTSFLDSNDFTEKSANEPQFIDVQHSHEWNAEYYYDQQKRQQELQSIFNFKQNGGDKMLAQPTKLQNKRHQINSLVMSAAESEFEMLEAKGRQMKTKYETQSKYGW